MTSIFIATKNKINLTELANHGVHLINHLDLLSSIGEEHQLMRLDDCVYTPTEQIAEFLKSVGATEEEIEQANPELWFSAKEGLTLIKSYIKIISNYHSLSQTTKSVVLPELIQFRTLLELLCAENNEWHFEYDL